MAEVMFSLVKRLDWLLTPRPLPSCQEWLDEAKGSPEYSALLAQKLQEVDEQALALGLNPEHSLFSAEVFKALDEAYNKHLWPVARCFFSARQPKPQKDSNDQTPKPKPPQQVWAEALLPYWQAVEKVLHEQLTDEDEMVYLPGILNRLQWPSLGACQSPEMVSFDTIYPLFSPSVLVSLTEVVSQVEAPLAEVSVQSWH